jgi:hypothetical protein
MQSSGILRARGRKGQTFAGGKLTTSALVQTLGPCKGQSRPGHGQSAVDGPGKVVCTRVRTEKESATLKVRGESDRSTRQQKEDSDLGGTSSFSRAFTVLLAFEYSD